MPDQGLAIFSPFKIALVIAFTFLAWGDLTHGDQTALTAQALIIALYINDLYQKRHQFQHAKRLTFREFILHMREDWKSFNLKRWIKNLFDVSTRASRQRLKTNAFFMLIICAPFIMYGLKLTEKEQEQVLIAGFVLWSLWFIVHNLKVFFKTKELTRLFFSNIGVYFLLCSLILVL